MTCIWQPEIVGEFVDAPKEHAAPSPDFFQHNLEQDSELVSELLKRVDVCDKANVAREIQQAQLRSILHNNAADYSRCVPVLSLALESKEAHVKCETTQSTRERYVRIIIRR